MGARQTTIIEPADIILIKNDPRDVPKAIELSKRTYKKIKQNLIWATEYMHSLYQLLLEYFMA